jgi:hypothetical protein
MDLFVVPTIGFELLYAFVIVRLDRIHIEAFVAHLGQEIRADLLAMLSGRQKFFVHRDAISDR